MTTGDTFVASVEEGLNTMVASARSTREWPTDPMQRHADVQRLAEGTGTTWREFLAGQMTAQNYGETDEINNPQKLDGSILSGTPQLVSVQTFIGKRVQARLSPTAFKTFGQLAQQAMDRKADIDGHALFASASVTLGASATTLASSSVLAGVRRITSNVNEPGPNPIAIILHGIAIHDIQSEIIAGIGTYPVPEGYTAEVFKAGFKGMLGDGNVIEDGNIVIDSTPNVRGGVFSKMSAVLVRGMAPWKEERYEPQKGYGGLSVWLKDEYVWLERSPGNWLYGLLSDGTQPT